jgi:hypothetical protein
MAAGLGFKDFVTGEVLTAADVDGYLMQGVWVFASAAARDAAVTSPQEGNFAYLKDTNVTTYYTGSAWANLDTTGMTNPMTTTGDIVYSSPGSTPVRLGIGTANQQLRVNSGATAPEWFTPAAGGASALTYITSASPSAVSTISIDNCFTSTYRNYLIVYNLVYDTGGGYALQMRLRASGTDNTSSNYSFNLLYLASNTATIGNDGTTTTAFRLAEIRDGGESGGIANVFSPQATARTTYSSSGGSSFSTNNVASFAAGSSTVTTGYDGFTLLTATGTFTGTIRVYGVSNS